jgi:hypothetical protein
VNLMPFGDYSGLVFLNLVLLSLVVIGWFIMHRIECYLLFLWQNGNFRSRRRRPAVIVTVDIGEPQGPFASRADPEATVITRAPRPNPSVSFPSPAPLALLDSKSENQSPRQPYSPGTGVVHTPFAPPTQGHSSPLVYVNSGISKRPENDDPCPQCEHPAWRHGTGYCATIIEDTRAQLCGCTMTEAAIMSVGRKNAAASEIATLPGTE